LQPPPPADPTAEAQAEDPFPSPSPSWTTHGPGSPLLAAASLPAIEPGEPWLYAVTATGIALAALGAIAATGLLGHSPTLLAELLDEADHPRRDAIAAEIERRSEEYLVLALLSLGLGWVIAPWAVCGAVGTAWCPIAMGSLLLGLLFAAGSLPVALAQRRAERMLLWARPGLQLAWWLLRWPVVLPLLATTRGLLWLSGVRPPAADDAAEVQKQVLAAVADSVAAAELPPTERTWIGNIVALKDLEVAAVMRPRPDIIAFQADLPLQQALQQAMEHGYSRYPVYEERIDEIAGIFHVKDALRLLQSDDPKLRQTPLRELLHEPLFVPETMGLAVLLRRFQKDQLHLAIVLDEYGTTAGLVSLEDVLEQIVGDLGDEYDTPEETTAASDRIEVLEAGRVIEVSGRTPVSIVNEYLQSELPEDGDFETIAGLVIAECNRIPAVDETVAVGQTEFRVLAADDRRIHRLRVSLLQPEASEGAR